MPSLILGLPATRCPLNVAGFVMPVVINPVEREMSIGFRTQSSVKLVKRLKQKFYPSSSVIKVLLTSGVVASFFRMSVCSIFNRVAHSVRSLAGYHVFGLIATTRFGQSVSDSIPVRLMRFSAVAPKKPFFVGFSGFYKC
jgi:hypothetical protein